MIVLYFVLRVLTDSLPRPLRGQTIQVKLNNTFEMTIYTSHALKVHIKSLSCIADSKNM